MSRFIAIADVLADFPEGFRPTLRNLREDMIARRLAIRHGKGYVTTPAKARKYLDQIEEEGTGRCLQRPSPAPRSSRTITPRAANGIAGGRIRSGFKMAQSNDDEVMSALAMLAEARAKRTATGSTRA